MELPQIKEEAINMLKADDVPSYLKIECIFFLMNIADDESLDAIFDVMRGHPCELVRHEAAFALGETASDRAVEVLKEVHVADKAVTVMHETLMSLGTIGNDDDVVFVKKALEHEVYEVSASAQIALERIYQREDFDLLLGDIENKRDKFIEKLLDPVKTCRNDRIQIIFQLMTLADDRSIDALYDSLINDPCPIVRHEAAFALGEIGCERSTYYLEQGILQEKNVVVIHEALFALGTSGRKEVLGFLQKYINHSEYIVSESAKIAIDRLNFLDKPYSGKEMYEYLKYSH